MKKKLIPGSLIVILVIIVLFISLHYKGDSTAGKNLSKTPNIQPTVPKTTNAQTTITSTAKSAYKDGQYSGNSVSNTYGNVQVEVIIANGKVSDIVFLKTPEIEAQSQFISSQADPILKQEAIKAQNANVDIVTGATSTSESFQQSLSSALSKAMNT